MTIEEIKTVCYVGAGTMGCYNSLAAAIRGYDVVLYDVDENTLEQIPRRHREFADMLVGGGFCQEEDIPDALKRVSVTSDLRQAVANAELVSESVFERLDIKRDIHQTLGEICSANAIITTNSSVLQVSDLQDVFEHGDNFAALHTHLGSPLVDIVPGPRTDPAVIDVLRRYVLSLDAVPLVLKKEYRGYVLNAMLGPLMSTALALVLDGGADPEAVDRAWMVSRNASMGPFGMIDLFGMDLMRDSWQREKSTLYLPHLQSQALACLQSRVDRGELGIKSGSGFYQYPEPAYQKPGFLGEVAVSGELQQTLAVALIGNGVKVAAAGVAEPADIDKAWTVGTFLEQGPFSYLEAMGPEQFARALEVAENAGYFPAAIATKVRAYLQSDNLVA